MKGKVLSFDIQTSKGVISGDDGNRYSFSGSDWKTSDINPENGVIVDFVANDGVASEIYAEKKANSIDDFVKSDNVFMRYYVGTLKKYAQFEGRAGREEFWYFTLFNALISIVLSMISAGAMGLIYSIAVFVPSIAIGARRLHDTNRSGWWQLIALIPIIGVIVLIIFFILDSQKEDNRFGPNPKQLTV